MRNFLILIIALFSIFASNLSLANGMDSQSAKDLKTLKKQAGDFLCAGHKISDKVAFGYSKTLTDEGFWEDIEYLSKSRGGWKALTHFGRIQYMSRAYKSKSNKNTYKNQELLNASVKALNFWADHAFVNSNWWYQDIGVPLAIADICMILGDDLPKQTISKLRPIFERSSMKKMTGQNLVWTASVQFFMGLIYNESERVRIGRDSILSEVRIASNFEEGIQPDFSYHQHGAMMQFGNYGLGYIGDHAKFAQIMRQTQYAYPPEKIEILNQYLFEGLQYVVYKGVMDFSACARQFAPKAQQSKGRGLINTARNLKKASSQSLEAKFDEVINQTPSSSCKYFPYSDFLTFHRPEFYFSARMNSSRTIGAETVNSENKKGLYSADGMIQFVRDNTEYKDIGALFDWKRLPGVTSSQKDTNLVCKKKRNTSSFVGGISDGKIGFATMDFKTQNLSFKKTFFCFDEYVAVICSDVKCSDAEGANTTINSCHLRGKIKAKFADGSEREVLKGITNLDKLTELEHDSIKYIFPIPQNVIVQNQTRKGNWSEIIEHCTNVSESEIFTAYIDHTKQVDSSEKILYFMKLANSQTPYNYKHLGENLPNIHGIFDETSKTAFIVFFEKGSVEIPIFGILKAEQKCILKISSNIDGYEVWACNLSGEFSEDSIYLNNKKIAVKHLTVAPNKQ